MTFREEVEAGLSEVLEPLLDELVEVFGCYMLTVNWGERGVSIELDVGERLSGS